MHPPTGVLVHDGRVVVAWHHRLLVWDELPTVTGTPPDHVLGQPDATSVQPNAGGALGATTFYWPFEENHPDDDRPADAVLGQVDCTDGTEFPYVSQAGRLRFPYGISSVDGELAIADTANNRVLLCATTDAVHDAQPVAVLGQPTCAAHGENRWERVAADTLCWPYGLHWHHDDERELLAVADSGNNRVEIRERS